MIKTFKNSLELRHYLENTVYHTTHIDSWEIINENPSFSTIKHLTFEGTVVTCLRHKVIKSFPTSKGKK